MHKHYLVSIIIATFNSEKTLKTVLESLKNQNFPKKNLEVIVIDGGSTDKTLSLCKSFGCKVLHNSKVEPLYAKYLGYVHSSGRYLMYLDHDEELVNRNSIKNRVEMFSKHKDVKGIVASGYMSPKGYSIINNYINEYGDAFSFFMYRLSKNYLLFPDIMKKRYKYTAETAEYVIVDISSGETPLIELAAGGGMVDADYMKKNFPEIIDDYTRIPHFLHMLRSTYPNIAVMKSDGIRHYSSDNLQSYVQKVIWRIKNNIFYTKSLGASGFDGRLVYHSSLARFKKYFFVPYSYSMLLPLLDALSLCINRRKIAYLIHIPLCYITSTLIVYYYFQKFLGIKPELLSYDGTKKAYEK